MKKTTMAVLASVAFDCILGTTASAAVYNGVEYSDSGDIVPGEMTSQFKKAKSYADDNNVPLVVMWVKPGDGYCGSFERSCLQKEAVLAWMKSRKYVFVFAVGQDTSDGSSAWTYASQAGDNPMCRVHWKKNTAGQAVNYSFTGRNEKMHESQAKTKLTLGEQFMEVVDLYVGDYVPESSADGDVDNPRYADTVVYGTIRTAEAKAPVAGALAVKGGKYVYVGDEAGAAAYVKDGVTEVVDHRGKGMVMPGCTDGHSHYVMKFGLENMKGGILFDLNDDKAKVLERVEAAARTAQAAGKTCIFGFGWNLATLKLQGTPPTLKEFDDITDGLSMVIFAHGGHHAYCNSECLKRCGIIDGKGNVLITKIDGGLLELDENGYPTGFVDERVTGYLMRMGGVNYEEIVDDEVAEASIRASQGLLLSAGYTIAMEGWSNMLHPSKLYEAAKRLDDNRDLKLVFPMTYEVEPWQTNMTEQIDYLDSLNRTYRTRHVLPEYLMVFMDGCVESMTGAMLRPYTDKDGTVYKSFWSVDRLAGITTNCNARGLTVHTHTMGDAAVKEVTDAYVNANELSGGSAYRNCLVHLRHVSTNDYQRFAANNIACSAGFTWHVSIGEVDDLLKNFLDEEYVKHAYPMKSFFDAGVKVSSHSDFPANAPGPQDPFGIMQVAVTGLLPNPSGEDPFDTDELVTVEQVFQALTLNGAWQVGLENERGSIAVGKWADFVLADRDVFECEKTDIGKTKVVSTWFEGEMVYPISGSEGNPWKIGATTNDAVTAWTNGTGRLVVEGKGAMRDFVKSGPWGAEVVEADFGAQVTTVGAKAFKGCASLETLVMRGNPPALGAGNDLSGAAKIVVREDALAKFEDDPGWTAYAAKFESAPVCYDYANMRTLAPFLHEIWYDDYVFDEGGETLSKDEKFACSSVRNGNFIGRNFDFFLDDKPEFVVHVAADPEKGRLASVGMAMHAGLREDGVTNGQYTASYDLVPNRMLDGINEKGVAINQNVVAYDPEVAAGPGREFHGTNPDGEDLNISFVTRMVLDRATNAAHAVELIKSRNLVGMSVSGDLLHYMISDPKETFVVEIITNAVVARHFKMMTNFAINWDNGNARALTDADNEVWTRDCYPEPTNLVVAAGNFDDATNALARYYALHAEGVERFIRLRDHYDEGATFEGMASLMRRAQYSQASYLETRPYWYSDRCSVALDKELVKAGFPALANTHVLYGLKYYPSKTGMVGFRLDNFLDRELMAYERECLADKDAHRKEDSGVWLTVHSTTYDIERRMFRIAAQEDYDRTFDVWLKPPTTLTVVVGDSGKRLGEEDPASLATNFQVRVSAGGYYSGGLAGYCVRAKGEAPGSYAVNFVCTRMPQDYDVSLEVVPGAFTITDSEDIVAHWAAEDRAAGYPTNGYVHVRLGCDGAKGKVRGEKVYKLNKKTGSVKVSINATPAKDYVFAGWYLDPGFSKPAYDYVSSGSNTDYRQPSQTIAVSESTYLFARFVEKTTKADPITHLRFLGAGYCGADASEFAEEETWYRGVRLPTNGCTVAFGSLSLPTVTVSGLPSGVKFDKKAQRFTGAPTAASTEKKPFFTVKISVKNKSGATDMIVRRVRVEPLPAWTVGTFDGICYGADTNACGTVTFTVSNNGRASGKTLTGGKSVSFSATALDDVVETECGDLVFVAHPTAKVGKETKILELLVYESLLTGIGSANVFYDANEDVPVSEAVQNGWKLKPVALPLFPTGRGALTCEAPMGIGLALKFGAKGDVTAKGTVPGDNLSPVSVSAKTQVLPLAWTDEGRTNLVSRTCVYLPPKKNLATGFCEVYNLMLEAEESGAKIEAVRILSLEEYSDTYHTITGFPGGTISPHTR